ncbi:MAG: hypothetical protein D6798_12290 [Deltaproteobacteria bacterium]|nr:MAG: hypothetical protein D6798_12290 [Deltaproteobacteria bacterium]
MHRPAVGTFMCTLAGLAACVPARSTPHDSGSGLDSGPSAADTGGSTGSQGDGGSAGGDRFHPDGYDDPAVHGLEAKLNVQDCRDCHGADLAGGSGLSCDSCHPEGWRTDCTFCHGGSSNPTGAPPLDIDGTADPAAISFMAHTTHVTGSIAAPFDCSECHLEPDEATSPGHLFDDTPAVAEVDFSAGLSDAGLYDGKGGCSNLYCHGDGRGDNGTSVDDGVPRTCASCHPDETSGSTAWSSMSGEHSRHLNEGLDCAWCHFDDVDHDKNVIDPSLHVDGMVEQTFEKSTIWRISGTCIGYCHGQLHWESW